MWSSGYCSYGVHLRLIGIQYRIKHRPFLCLTYQEDSVPHSQRVRPHLRGVRHRFECYISLGHISKTVCVLRPLGIHRRSLGARQKVECQPILSSLPRQTVCSARSALACIR
ncbi:hypothetical protein U1Q18_005213 [Sarracenia purpurea var. burkii]